MQQLRGLGVDEQFLAWPVPFVLLLIAFALLIPSWVHAWNGQRVKRAVKRLGRDVAHHLMLPDGVEGYVFVDHLVLARDALIVLLVKPLTGAIFCGSNMDLWAQIEGNRSYKFPNPLRELEKAVIAVKTLVPDVVVEGMMVFDKGSHFPKGKPEQVVHISEIVSADAPVNGEPAIAAREAWSRVVAVAHAARTDHATAMRQVTVDRVNRRNSVIALLLVLVAALWVLSLTLMR